MNPWETIAPQDTRPMGWKALHREIAAIFFTELPAALMSVGHMASPDELDAYQTAAEEGFHAISAAALGMNRSDYERAAAAGRIEWARADTAHMHPPCLVRLDGREWRKMQNLAAVAIPAAIPTPAIPQRLAA